MTEAQNNTIIYTCTDEAPALATRSLLPVIRLFTRACGIIISVKDISLAGRILAAFPENLTEDQKCEDALAALGAWVKQPGANIIKLPNISASIPQLSDAIKELQAQGCSIPDYPENPQTPEEQDIQNRYGKVLGSAVNPVLREGNSQREPIPAAKAYAKAKPPPTAPWSKSSKTRVTHMEGGDFYANEKSATLKQALTARIEYVDMHGAAQTLKDGLALQKDEIIDATFMSVQSLRTFIKAQMQNAKQDGTLFSVHLKATMMKKSDPVIFGHVLEVFFEDLFQKHGALFAQLGIDARNGLSDIEEKISALPADQQAEITADINAALDSGPPLYMADAKEGITNLHAPNKVIIDASVPPIIRWGGQATGPDGAEHDTLIVIPDRTYAVFHKEMAEFSRQNGTFNPATMGSVINIGLMAQKAEEYGSHDKTFIAPGAGQIRVIGEDGAEIITHSVEQGDIWRLCQAKDAPIKNWIELAIARAKISGDPLVFWLDENRAHDAQLIKKVSAHLAALDTQGVDTQILAPEKAARLTNQRITTGQNIIAATGNVLRDHLTDMYPILELGTSAKMLSIVPLMHGGALLETGAGGSAPKHVEQFMEEGHLRWDSLGEFAALAASLDHLARTQSNPKAAILATALNEATTTLLNEEKSPARSAGDPDNRDSHYWVARYWARALADQSDDAALQSHFTGIADQLEAGEEKILKELAAAQGQKVDLGGYYRPDDQKANAAMRPSKTLNEILSLASAV